MMKLQRSAYSRARGTLGSGPELTLDTPLGFALNFPTTKARSRQAAPSSTMKCNKMNDTGLQFFRLVSQSQATRQNIVRSHWQRSVRDASSALHIADVFVRWTEAQPRWRCTISCAADRWVSREADVSVSLDGKKTLSATRALNNSTSAARQTTDRAQGTVKAGPSAPSRFHSLN